MKRFTETTKWADPWFRGLSPASKCLWIYMCDNCDAAGVIDLDVELAAFQIGAKLKECNFEELAGRIVRLPSKKWWVVKFIQFQYGRLSEDCKAHGPAWKSVRENTLEEWVSKGYPYPLERDKVTVKDKEEVKDTVKDTDTAKGLEPRKDRADEAEIIEFCESVGLSANDGSYCYHHWTANGWMVGGKPIKDWKATVRAWKAAGHLPKLSESNGTHLSFREQERERDAAVHKTINPTLGW